MICLINPNSTVSMTDAMLRTARAAAPHARFEGWTSEHGPPSIQGPADGDAAEEPLLDLVAQASRDGASAIIIGCFDDTALDQARAIAACPVVGIGQAACHFAALAGARFSVVTTLEVSVPILAQNIERYGLAGSVSRIRASNVPVLDLERDPEAATRKVISEIVRAAREDRINSVVLGCGGMVDIAERAADHTPIRLIDGVRAAAAFTGAI